MGVQIGTGRIVFVDGPDPGSKNDARTLRESEIMAEIIQWDPFEIVLADKGYVGIPYVLTPFKKTANSQLTPSEAAFNEVLASVDK